MSNDSKDEGKKNNNKNSATKTKSKSPPAPSYSLEDSYQKVRKVYEEYGTTPISESEFASELDYSSSSGSWTKRFFTFREFGLIAEVSGGDYKVTEIFHDLYEHDLGTAGFQQAAERAIRSCSLFDQVLEQFSDKLPSSESLGNRLVRKYGFNPGRGEDVAELLHESLKFAGIIDSKGNLVRIRADRTSGGSEDEHKGVKRNGDEERGRSSGSEHLTLELPTVSGEQVQVAYPRNFTEADAETVATVLRAVAARAGAEEEGGSPSAEEGEGSD